MEGKVHVQGRLRAQRSQKSQRRGRSPDREEWCHQDWGVLVFRAVVGLRSVGYRWPRPGSAACPGSWRYFLLSCRAGNADCSLFWLGEKIRQIFVRPVSGSRHVPSGSRGTLGLAPFRACVWALQSICVTNVTTLHCCAEFAALDLHDIWSTRKEDYCSAPYSKHFQSLEKLLLLQSYIIKLIISSTSYTSCISLASPSVLGTRMWHTIWQSACQHIQLI